MIGASDEQLDVFNEVWYIVLLNSGQIPKGTKSISSSFILLIGSKAGTVTAIEALEKQVSKRPGAPFLWRLLVCFIDESVSPFSEYAIFNHITVENFGCQWTRIMVY